MGCKLVLAGVAAALLTLTGPGSVRAGGDVDGDYKIVEDGKVTWFVHVEKAPKGKGYRVTWTEKSSGEAHKGIGVRDGDAFAAGSEGPWVGVYRVQANGDLVGRTFYQGKPEWSGADRWVKVK